MANVLFISHDVVGNAMAGPGIRAFELSRVLATEHDVTLAIPGVTDVLPQGVHGYTYRFGDATSLAPALAAADVIIANSCVLNEHPELATRPVPLVLDMYDPTPLENLALMRDRDSLERLRQQRRDVALLTRQLRTGDCFLCATERQRDLYLGALLAIGRISADLADVDPVLRALLRVVPFGLPSTSPIHSSPPWPDLGPDALVILWSGGLWDWMDPLTLIRAMPLVLAQVPQARLVFLAGQNPGNDYPMQMPDRARMLALEMGLIDREVIFVDHWIPYNERAGALLNAHVAVYLHNESLESSYAAVRSRFLDHLWAGLPSVVSAGDAAAALVETRGLGRTVVPGDMQGTADALVALLRDEAQRRTYAANATALAPQLTWECVAMPLIDFCRNPQRAPDRLILSEPGVEPASSEADRAETDQTEAVAEAAERDRHAQAQDTARNAALGALTANWQVAERPLPGGFIGRLRQLLVTHIVRPFVAPLIEQQNAHNAGVLRALDALAESADARRSETYALLDRQDLRLSSRLRAVEISADGAEVAIGALNAELSRLRTRVAQLEARLIDLDDADTALAERIAQLFVEQQEGHL